MRMKAYLSKSYNMEHIESENKFIWKFIFHLLITPITLVQILFKKKEWKDLFLPVKELCRFIVEPKFTLSIIMLNIIIYIAGLFFSPELFDSLVNYPSNLLHLRLQTLVTAGFLHGSITHLLGNMIGLFIFGRVVERKLGFAKTALVYLGALIVSSLFSSLIHLFILGNNIGGIGASGALMGLIATAILLDPFYLTYELIIPLPIMIAGWLGLYADIAGILNPAEDGIGHFAHIGGFLSIALLMYVIGIDDRSALKKGLIINIL